MLDNRENSYPSYGTKEKTPFSSRHDRDLIFKGIMENEYKDEAENVSVDALIRKGDLVAAIDGLFVDKDKANEIKSRYVVVTSPEGRKDVRVLLRDSTEISKNRNEKSTYHNWAIMGLNYFEAAKKLAQVYGKEFTPSELADLDKKAMIFFESVQKSGNPEATLGLMIHQEIMPLLVEKLGDDVDRKSIEKQLAEARDFCNFDHPSCVVATRTRIEIAGNPDMSHMDVLQIDVPMCGAMDETLTNQFAAIADWNIHHDDEKISNIKWFTDQPQHIKALIAMHAEDVLDGKIIPTQLRKYLPGIRNAGEERLYDVTPLANGQINGALIYAGYHSGTPAHLLGNDELNQTATNGSLVQLEKLTGASQLNVHTLLSPTNVFAEDPGLVKQVAAAVDETKEKSGHQIHYSNTAINWWRRIGSGFDVAGSDTLLKKAQSLSRIERLDADVKRQLSAAMEEYKNLRNGSDVLDGENKNLSLVSATKLLAHWINMANKSLGKSDSIAQVDSCQSGKDREGLVRIKTANDALMLYTRGRISPIDPADKMQEKNIRQAMACSGQVRKQAGLQGGTLGAEGIKSDTKGGVPDSYRSKDYIEKTASYNKKLPKKPETRAWYKRPKFLLGIAVAAVAIVLCATGIGAIAGIPLLAGAASGLLGTAVSMLAVGALTASVASYGVLRDQKSANKNRLVLEQMEEVKKIENANYKHHVEIPVDVSDKNANSTVRFSEVLGSAVLNTTGMNAGTRNDEKENSMKVNDGQLSDKSLEIGASTETSLKDLSESERGREAGMGGFRNGNR